MALAPLVAEHYSLAFHLRARVSTTNFDLFSCVAGGAHSVLGGLLREATIRVRKSHRPLMTFRALLWCGEHARSREQQVSLGATLAPWTSGCERKETHPCVGALKGTGHFLVALTVSTEYREGEVSTGAYQTL